MVAISDLAEWRGRGPPKGLDEPSVANALQPYRELRLTWVNPECQINIHPGSSELTQRQNVTAINGGDDAEVLDMLLGGAV